MENTDFDLDPEIVQKVADTASRTAKGGGGSKTSGAGDMALLAGKATGNPYLMAGGAALKVVGSVGAKRQAERQQKADAENRRRTKLMAAMGNLGSGVGSTGM